MKQEKKFGVAGNRAQNYKWALFWLFALLISGYICFEYPTVSIFILLPITASLEIIYLLYIAPLFFSKPSKPAIPPINAHKAIKKIPQPTIPYPTNIAHKPTAIKTIPPIIAAIISSVMVIPISNTKNTYINQIVSEISNPNTRSPLRFSRLAAKPAPHRPLSSDVSTAHPPERRLRRLRGREHG